MFPSILLFKTHEFKTKIFWDTPKPVLDPAWHGIRSCFGKLLETLEPEESHKPEASPASHPSWPHGQHGADPTLFNIFFRENPHKAVCMKEGDGRNSQKGREREKKNLAPLKDKERAQRVQRVSQRCYAGTPGTQGC